MGRTLTRNANLQVARESSIGTLPGSPSWLSLQPNEFSLGAEIVKTARDKLITKDRNRRKGAVTDLNSAVRVDSDLIMEHLDEFVEASVMSASTWTANAKRWVPTAVVAATDTFTVPSGGAITAGWLVHARGFANAANNGLHVVDVGSTGTTVKVTTALVDEAAIPATQNVSLQVAGVQTAVGDLDMNASGHLTCTALDFTTLGLTVGQVIKIGGATAATQFSTAANNGYARIAAIAANLLTLDRRSATFVVEANTTKTVQIFFGGFVRNVAVDHASFLGPGATSPRSYTFEAAYENLGAAAGDDAFEYARGNVLNVTTIGLPLAEKASLTLEFVGTTADSPVEVGSRATNASSPRAVVSQMMYNTTSDLARLIVAEADETGLSTDFKSLSFKVSNNVQPEKVLGTLGAAYMNHGGLSVDAEMELLFSDLDVIDAIRNNETVGMWFTLKNTDGGVAVDVPSMELDTAKKGLPEDASITVSLTGHAIKDATLGTSVSFSMFPYLP